MKNWKVYIGICVFAGTLGFISSCDYFKTSVKQEAEPVTKINDTTVAITKEAMASILTTKAKTIEFPDKLDLMGRISVTEDRTTVVPARVTGRTESVYVASGETVKKGQPLLSLFSPDFVAAREEYLQSKKESQTGSKDTSDFSDLSKMARRKLMTMGLGFQDIDLLTKDRAKERNLTIRAPRAGIIITKNAVIGNLVNVGDTLFTIADVDKVWFTGDLYPEDVLKVHKGQEVQIDSPDGEKILGSVSFISPVVDPQARTIKIRSLMDNPKFILKADMYVQGSLLLQRKQKLVIPTRALTRLENSYTVFKRISDGQFQKVKVEVGTEQGEFTSIESGLKDGDEVISDGSALLLNATLNTASR
jgi:Cu(I)/Ag(I) efflux system membrane fusion protein